MKKNRVKAGGTKYTLNYSPIEIKTFNDKYEEAIALGEVRTIKSYFAEACLSSKLLKSNSRAFTDLINLFINKKNQFHKLGATYVFGVPIRTIILHKAADTVVRTNSQLERDLLSYILKVNKANKTLYLEFVPGFILKIKGMRSIEVLFDFRESIRNY